MFHINTYKNDYLVRCDEKFYNIMYMNKGEWREDIGGWIISSYNVENVIDQINKRIDDETYDKFINKSLLCFLSASLFTFVFYNVKEFYNHL